MWKTVRISRSINLNLKIKRMSSLKVLVAMWVTGSLHFHDDSGRWHSPSTSISVAHRNSGLLSLRFMSAFPCVSHSTALPHLPPILYWMTCSHKYNVWIYILALKCKIEYNVTSLCLCRMHIVSYNIELHIKISFVVFSCLQTLHFLWN